MDNILKPLEESAGFDSIDIQIKSLFLALMRELYAEKINDIYNYGTPSYGSQKVVEHFTKQVGLVVLRRPTTSHLIMRILYENWTSLASKRGLEFLEFALELLWTGKWDIMRLWHSKTQSNLYPNLVTVTEQPGSFLTSRIYVLMNSNIDASELENIAPSLERLVPSNIVPEIGIKVDVEEDAMTLGVAFGIYGIQIAYFVPEAW